MGSGITLECVWKNKNEKRNKKENGGVSGKGFKDR